MARLIPLLLALYGLPLFGAAHDFEIEKAETSYRLNPDNTAEIVYYQKQRAVTPRGRESLSRVQVAYVPEFHEVEIQFIRTLKKDGTTVEGNPASAFDANASNNPLSAYFTDSHVKVLLPPNVETGDAVEYRAVLHVRRWIKPGDFWFAHLPTTGVVKSETVVLDLPADRKIALYENPATPGKVETGSGRRIERWETSSTGEQPEATGDVAPPMFAVSSVLSWEDFGAWIRSLNRGPMQPTPEITALAARLTAGKSGEMEKIAALYSYVATKVRYIAIEFGSGRIQPHGAGEVLRNSYGDCKDQTALLSALLNAAGFKTRAVLVHPFAGVYIPEVPSIVSFSHEFTAVETKGGLVYLDSSMGPVQPQVMAPGIRGRKALVIGEDSASIVEIPEKPPVPTRFELTIKGAVSSTGGFESSVRVETSGVMELPFRRLFLDSTSADQEKALLSFGAQSAAVRQITHGDPADLTKPFWVAFEGSNPKFFPEPNATIRMDLANGAFPLQSFESTKRPTKPIPVEPFTIAIKMDLMVSGNFTVDTGMPVHRKIPAATYDSEFTYEKGHQYLTRSLVFTGKPVAPEDWDELLKFERDLREEIGRGLSLERQRPYQRPSSSPELTRVMHDGAEAWKRSDFENAKKNYLEALRLDPQNREALNELGRALNRLREYDKAIETYKRLIALDPKNPYAYNNIAIAYRATKREDDALAMYRKQLEITPRDLYTHNNLGTLFAARKQWEDAIHEAKIVTELSPDNANTWAQLGRYQLSAGHNEDGAKSFDRALAMPHAAVVENNAAYYLAESGYQLDRARQLILGTLEPAARRVCEPEEITKDNKCAVALTAIANWLDTAAWVIYKEGKVKESEAYARSAWAISAQPTMGAHLSLILAVSGRIEEALKIFSEARTRPGFDTADDLADARAALAKAAGADFEARRSTKDEEANVRVVALVEGSGKVVKAEAFDPQTPAAAVTAAKSLMLAPIAWGEHSLRSIRTVELRQDGDNWVVVRSAVGQPVN